MAAYLPCRDSYHPELCLQYARAVSDRSRGTAGGIFLLEPDVAEHWETPDDTSYLFQLRHGVNTCGALDTHKTTYPRDCVKKPGFICVLPIVDDTI